MRCEQVIELLPWLLNRSLGPEEREAVREHLACCPECRGELAATAEAGRLHGTHPPTEAVVALAFGDRNVEGGAAVERHLEHCAPCRGELELAAASAEMERMLATAEAAGEGGAGWGVSARRWLAVAAAVVVAVLLGAVLAPRSEAPSGISVGHPVLDLVPEELVLRGGEAERPGAPANRLPERADWVTVVLSAPGVPEDGLYRIELRENGQTLWRSEPTRPGELQDFSLLVPAETLRGSGRVLVVLSAEDGGEPWATYRLD